MAKKGFLETEVERWRGLSLILIFTLGVVGALSYTLLIRHTASIVDNELEIERLEQTIRELRVETE